MQMCVHVHTLTCREEDSLKNASGAIYLAFHCCFHLFVGTVSYWESLTHQRSSVISQKLSTRFTGQNLLLNPIKLG